MSKIIATEKANKFNVAGSFIKYFGKNKDGQFQCKTYDDVYIFNGSDVDGLVKKLAAYSAPKGFSSFFHANVFAKDAGLTLVSKK